MSKSQLALSEAQLRAISNGAKLPAQLNVPCLCPACKKLITVIVEVEFCKAGAQYDKIISG